MPNIAILIDAENVAASYADSIFSQAAKMGEICGKEIYGTAQALTAWVEPVLKYAIHPNLTIKAAKGKNSSDIALVIGAMDLIVAGQTDTVVIASSDSDFSSLSVRLRTAGMNVIGMGTEKSNPLWRTACSGFVTLTQNHTTQAKAAAPRPARPAQNRQREQNRETPAASQTPAKPDVALQEAPAKPEPPRAGAQATSHPEPEARRDDRTATVRAAIENQLRTHGGRMMVSQIVSALNGLKEYRQDRQASGKKPQNYLTGTFEEDFRFEINADGASWISLKDYVPEVAAPETADQPAQSEEPERARAETAVAEEAAAEPAQDQPTEAAAPADGPDQAVASEAEISVADGDTNPIALLMRSGLTEETAVQIAEICDASNGRRDAYNRLRTAFGSKQGAKYYHLIKELAQRQRL